MKNFVFISPNFPRRYYLWCEALARRGVRVLGIGDTPWNQCEKRLRDCLTDYVYVPNMNVYADMSNALASLIRKYGPIDGLESNNEWWLPTDAKLREEFDIPGLRPQELEAMNHKSKMKERFQQGGAKTIRYVLLNSQKDLDKALEFASQVGYPLFVKPDCGVGASESYRLKDESSLRAFFAEPLDVPHILEEFVDGKIVSFDGICDAQSNCVFVTTDHFPTPIADVVNQKLDYYYFDNPISLPMKDLDEKAFEETGRKVVKAFGITKRCFHIEFFVLNQAKEGLGEKGDFVALECNMRAPGGDTPDLMNYGSSCSVYDIFADVFLDRPISLDPKAKCYYAFASHRRDCYAYQHSLEEVFQKYGDKIVQWGRYPKGLADAMCDWYFDAKFECFEDGLAFDAFLREKKHSFGV